MVDRGDCRHKVYLYFPMYIASSTLAHVGLAALGVVVSSAPS